MTRGGVLARLLAAAAAIPTAAGTAAAQTAPVGSPELRLQYSQYRDYQGARETRMKVEAPSAWFRAPAGERGQLEGGAVVDTVSGASPLYLDTLSGASGLGIHDRRYGTDLKYTHFLDGFSLGAGGVVSLEDDYDSYGGSAESSVWSDDRNTTFTVALGGNADDITSTNDPAFSDTRKTTSYLAGVTRTLSRTSLASVSLGVSSGDGYFSDPYKSYDRRPRSRDAYSLLARYVAAPSADPTGSVHADYRLFDDSWSVRSHTLELSYVRPVSRVVTLVPLVRYSTQDGASFFGESFPPEGDGFYTADQRLSSFGTLSGGLKLTAIIIPGLAADLAYEHVYQDGSLKAGGGGTEGLASFRADVFTLGLTKRFDS